MSHFTMLRDELERHTSAATAILRKADDAHRDLTPAEIREVESHNAAAADLLPQVKAARADDRVRRQLAGLGPDREGFQPSGGYGGFAPASGYKGTSSAWAERVAGQLTKAAATHGVKDLAAGSLDVPNVVEVAVEIPARPHRLLDLVPTKSLPGNTFEFARQTLKTNNAAPVADHAQKPVSHFVFTPVEDRARVIAHITEPIALRMFDDHSELMSIIDAQLYDGVREEAEDQIAEGDGTGENFTGLLNTSGVLAQTYTSGLPTTLRAARTALEVTNETPTAWVLNPVDLATLDLLTDTTGRLLGAEVDHLMGSLPKVPSVAVPVGTALLGDFSQCRLYVREDAVLAIDRSGELFTHNQLIMRMEARFGFAVLRPGAFIKVDLTA